MITRQNEPSLPLISRVQRFSLLVGIIGLMLSGVGAYFQYQQFLVSYLFAYIFWIGISLGSLAILMIHYLTGGTWGLLIRRPLEAATWALPLMVVLFIPLAVGLSEVYAWARPEEIANNSLLQKKNWYLNIPFFLVRSTTYFIIWLGIAYCLSSWSRKQDKNPKTGIVLGLQRLSGGGLILLSLSVTFAAIDWVMSLVPEWTSTIFGFIFGISQMLAAMTFAVIIAGYLSNIKILSETFSPAIFHDFGNILLMFILLWVYLFYMEYLIVWSGNLPREISWYVPRVESSWRWVSMLLIVFYFIIPFVALLFRSLKRTRSTLVGIAAIIFLSSLVNSFWLVVPSLRIEGFELYWTDLVVPIGMGGFWLAVVLWRLQNVYSLPARIPVEEAMEHGR
ncbi:quinol:cytochrome c oxidoreductase quinone-binding subunit 2 [Nitrosococcus oceani ATCC 19707]|uniref:Quinol:cytochrome c oxidoreductase quinone-binding subunit 2 n=2 Tax=Nitrosococcus oceani TaxID=1229 RepID=Q3JBQ3_NITOC|nr:hypothetical protein [Nitrosococcus oceani]ABA57743.1 quinol:cytochrome c oxidoreductase quinone-binding subunit 2 [Nitrosococcus oceani ATCC 19707]KFI19831.1 hypothetical protein IB75_06485 [Nitrosococcus oceani C-27]